MAELPVPYRSNDASRAITPPAVDHADRPLTRRQARLRLYVPTFSLLAVLYFAVFQGYYLATLGIVAMVAVLLARRIYQSRLAVRLVRENDEAVAQLNSGDLEAAEAAFERIALRARPVPILHALAVFNRGAVAMRQGRVDEAITYVEAARASGWLNEPAYQLAPLALTATATCHAIKGDLDLAEAVQKQAHAIVSPSKRGLTMVLDAIIACRRGSFAKVAADIDGNWSTAEGALNAAQLRTLRLLRAFAAEHLGEDASAVAKRVDAARPTRAGEQSYVAIEWPEYRDFLARYTV
jgi:tetratricopeptide (TPR) repeat protein